MTENDLLGLALVLYAATQLTKAALSYRAQKRRDEIGRPPKPRKHPEVRDAS